MSEAAIEDWVTHHVAQVRPLERRLTEASWRASASGKSEDYEASAAADLAFQQLYANHDDYLFVKAARESNAVHDPLLARQIEVLYLSYLGNQFDAALMEKIVTLSSSIEGKFNNYRSEVDGRRLTDNEVEQILSTSLDSDERLKAWEASKRIGDVVAADVIALVKLRNEAARELGYENFYVLSLAQGEQEEQELFRLLDEMADSTLAPFQAAKAEIDEALAERYGLEVAALRPWHYEDRFFQEAPSVGAVDINPYFEGKDTIALSKEFYASIGLPVDAVLERSDLLGREGKYQHAYCTDIDRAGDVRVMASVQNDAYWMDTMLHELGHAVYSLGNDANAELPFILKDAAHTLSTEGVAQMMGRLSSNAYWLRRFAGIGDEELAMLAPKLENRTRVGALVFARWCQVMVHFERDLYYNPDQDLDALWWQYVSRYQLVTPPEGRHAPDWASKIHLVASPVYYHNYLLGELYAAQLHQKLSSKFFPGQDPRRVIFADNKAVGDYLNDVVFKPGMRWRWDRFVIESTGQPLSASAFAQAYMVAGSGG